jgi:hypothetical protein
VYYHVLKSIHIIAPEHAENIILVVGGNILVHIKEKDEWGENLPAGSTF